jgi:hypothetical protein
MNMCFKLSSVAICSCLNYSRNQQELFLVALLSLLNFRFPANVVRVNV